MTEAARFCPRTLDTEKPGAVDSQSYVRDLSGVIPDIPRGSTKTG